MSRRGAGSRPAQRHRRWTGQVGNLPHACPQAHPNSSASGGPRLGIERLTRLLDNIVARLPTRLGFTREASGCWSVIVRQNPPEFPQHCDPGELSAELWLSPRCGSNSSASLPPKTSFSHIFKPFRTYPQFYPRPFTAYENLLSLYFQ